MTRSCDLCGRSYEAARASSRYCSPACRTRAWRIGGAPPLGPRSHDCEAATRTALEAAGALGTPSGLVALVLACQVDDHARLTGGALAAVAKQFRVSLGKALEQAPRQRDRVDELTTRRLQRQR